MRARPPAAARSGPALALGRPLVLHVDCGGDVAHPGHKAVLHLSAVAGRDQTDVLQHAGVAEDVDVVGRLGAAPAPRSRPGVSAAQPGCVRRDR